MLWPCGIWADHYDKEFWPSIRRLICQRSTGASASATSPFATTTLHPREPLCSLVGALVLATIIEMKERQRQRHGIEDGHAMILSHPRLAGRWELGSKFRELLDDSESDLTLRRGIRGRE